ncbi:DUF4169 family protein [Kiloniella antarctica]|uniref:DUF4169 family protein n=1 Tax=Kiloniella antarctica TaxID=1550907 RepID=A0ABW5BJV6_9PROT
MNNVINLKQFRKDKAREAKASHAADNRVAHGRTKTERLISNTEKKNNLKNLDDHKLDKDT